MKASPRRFLGSHSPLGWQWVICALTWLWPLICEGSAAARLTINSGSGSMSSSSTNTSGSFQLENLSTDGEEIILFKIDLRTAMLPDVVFDPAGTAGDPDGKEFELDSFNGTGTPVHSFEAPHDGVGSEDGYDVLRIDFGPGVSFAPGETMTFSADIDPTNVKGAPGPGPNHSASISGLELIGATVTVTFDDGTVRTVRMGGLTGTSNTNKTSVGLLAPDNLPTPVISVPGQTSPFVATSQPTVRVTGPAGTALKLWVVYSTLYVDGVAGGGYDIDPFETNTAIDYDIISATIGAGGFVDVPVTLSHASATGGINLVSAVLVDGSRRSSCSNILTIDYDPDGGSSDEEAPTTPGNLGTGGITASSVTLVWSPSTDNIAVTGYRIYRDGNEAPVGTTTQLTFTDAGRTPLTEYDYEVAAFDAAGRESPPALLTVTTLADQQNPTPPGSIQAIPGDGSVQLSWTAATDDVAVTGYRVYRDHDQVPIATVTSLGFIDTGLVNGTEYDYEVTAIDAAEKESLAAAVSVTPAAPPPVSLRVNVGSAGSFVDPQGNTWVADFGYNTGNASTYTTAIQGTDNAQLYQSRRTVSTSQPELAYGFDLPDGNYRAVLHFVEVSGSFTSGSRVFDIVAEGTLKVDDMDIFDRVGLNTACVVEFPVTVSDGQLNLMFPRVASNPTLSGIEVFALLPDEPPTFEEWLVGHGLSGETTGDSDGGGLGNFAEFELQLDPIDAADDLEFRLECQRQAGITLISLPVLKPIGNYHLHRSTDIGDLGNVASRIDTVTRSEIEAMTLQQRGDYSVQDTPGGSRAFYQLYFEPAAE